MAEVASLKVCVVTSVPFPVGLASTNRIISYAKGLVELGNKVTVLTSASGNNTRLQSYNGIDFRFFRTLHESNLLNKISLPYAVISLLFSIWRGRESTDVVLLVSNSLVLILPLFIICKLAKLKYVQEKSEFPFVLNNTSIIGRLYARVYVNSVYRLFDGLIIMTHTLADYFTSKVAKKAKMIVVPMTVEPSRFMDVKTRSIAGDYIAYCGYMGGNKDGVENLIKSFGLIQPKFPSLSLVLIGPSSEKELSALKDLVKELGIINVIFYGPVDRDNMPDLLVNAKILALARPSSLQSLGGFPTKLGEYLSCNVPTVVTSTGDIPKFITDNTNGFLVPPDDNRKFAKKIEYVLNNYEKAKDVAKEGQGLTHSVFNYMVQSKRIHHYLEKLVYGE